MTVFAVARRHRDCRRSGAMPGASTRILSGVGLAGVPTWTIARLVTPKGNDFGDLASNEAQTSAESSAHPRYGALRGNSAPVATSLQVTLPGAAAATLNTAARAPARGNHPTGRLPRRGKMAGTGRSIRMSSTFEAALYARVSTEDRQSPIRTALRGSAASPRRLSRRTAGASSPSISMSAFPRSFPWSRRPEAARLLADCARADRGFDRHRHRRAATGAFAGSQYGLTAPLLWHHGVELWVPEVGGRVDPDSEAHDLVMSLFGLAAKPNELGSSVGCVSDADHGPAPVAATWVADHRTAIASCRSAPPER